jgi:hypothetical protein
MPRRITLSVTGLRTPAEQLPRRRVFGARALFVAKALVLLVAAASLSARLLPPSLPRMATASDGAVELRYPAGWETACRAAGSVALRESRDGSGEPCRAFLMCFALAEFARLYLEMAHRPLPDRWHDDEAGVASAVATVFGMGGALERPPAERIHIGGRPASLLTAYCRGQWTAVVIAAGDDLAIAGLCAPTARDLQRAWRSWKAMVAAARLREPSRAAPSPPAPEFAVSARW